MGYRRIGEGERMTCLLRNTCSNRYLCCHFCKNKQCELRCKDKHATCSWFDKRDPTQEDAQPPLFAFQKEREEKYGKREVTRTEIADKAKQRVRSRAQLC